MSDIEHPCPHCGREMGHAAGVGHCGVCELTGAYPDARNETTIKRLTQERDAALARCDTLYRALNTLVNEYPGITIERVAWQRSPWATFYAHIEAARQALTTAEAAASLKRGVADFQAGRTTPMPAADMDTP